MPVTVRIDHARSRVYLVLDGYIQDDEAHREADRVIKEVGELEPPFDVISDISTFKPGSPKAAAEMIRAQEAMVKRGLRFTVRIVSDDGVVAKMQLDRTSRVTGIKADYVTSLRAAEDLLAEKVKKAYHVKT